MSVIMLIHLLCMRLYSSPITALTKNDTNLQQKNLVYMNVRGTFCATCTATAYPCFILNSVEIKFYSNCILFHITQLAIITLKITMKTKKLKGGSLSKLLSGQTSIKANFKNS